MFEKQEWRVVLASGSPRRQAFLRELGLAFDVIVADIDETPRDDETPVLLAKRLAVEKAQAAVEQLAEESGPSLVIAADTVVSIGVEILGKPRNEAEAIAMLRRLRGRDHEVHSAVAVIALPQTVAECMVNSTVVQMREYTDEEIAAYVATGDPFDKAGAYAIQHETFAPAEAVDGCISGVMGLPLADLYRLLARYETSPVRTSELVAVCEQQAAFACCQRRAGGYA